MAETFEYGGKEYSLHVSHYTSDPMVMALSLDQKDEEEGYFEPYCVLSVNLGNDIGNGSFMQHGATFLDTNNVRFAEELVAESGLGKPYERFGEPVIGQSGWCEYPLYQFDMERLAELDPSGVEQYTETYKATLGKVQEIRNRQMGFGDFEDDEPEPDDEYDGVPF